MACPVDQAATQIVIDPSGDMLLVVQVDGKIRELMVSSKIMSVASSAFKTMFESKSQEGIKLQHGPLPASLTFPDDDGAALTTICRVVHFRAREVSSSLTADDLVNMSSVANTTSPKRYGCGVRPLSSP